VLGAWNEPDQTASYCGDISSMVTMAQHAYAIIKSIDPSATVLSPAASGEAGATWFDSFLTAGDLNTFDVVTFHGYGGALAELVMSRHNLSVLPLWDTECSWAEAASATMLIVLPFFPNTFSCNGPGE
jgi:hypothetical protein